MNWKPSDKLKAATPGIGGAAGFAGNMMDTLNRPDNFGHVKAGVSAGAGALKGAQMGAALGPWGMAAGAVAGGALGLIQAQKLNREADSAEAIWNQNKRRTMFSQSGVSYGQNSQYGNEGVGWAAYGGPMNPVKRMKFRAVGGNMKPLSEDTFLVDGPSHKGGGVYLPAHDAEVEGKEVVWDDYVFSNRLINPVTGRPFSHDTKKIGKALGKAERYGSPQSSVTASLLTKRLEKLQNTQEMIREMYSQKLLNA